MLSTLSIRDVVLIDRLDVEFQPGLSALTGETGAGKSILLDALGLALGARADSRLVRHGANQAVVSATFALKPEHPARALLIEHGIDDAEGDLVLRRTVGSDGRSRGFVNDQPVGVALLRRLGDMLVEIHGQFESQGLLDPSTHRDLLDAFGDLAPHRRAVGDGWAAWQTAEQAFAEAEAMVEEARSDEQRLRHAVEEMETLNPESGEEEELARRRALLMSGEKLMKALDAAAEQLSGTGTRSVEEALRTALDGLERVAEKAEGRLDEAIAALERALSETVEALALVERAATELDLDPGVLELAEERLFALRALARKHNCTVDELPRLKSEFESRLEAIDDGSALLVRLRREAAEGRATFESEARRLSEARRASATRLDRSVAGELAPLRLGKAMFNTCVDALDEREWGPSGIDRVSFQVSTNPGVPAGPLTRIASGGELARFMLALKVVLASADPVPTLVFDEVDAGVGGAVAAAVGERLAALAADVQVLTLTHSPQVAARGDHHWRVTKLTTDHGARTRIDVLDGDGRTEEIARMLAGDRITDEARAAASSLLHDGAP